jgi:hypothetical protein
LSGRDDQALSTVFKTWSRDGLVTPGLTQIVGELKIQGQGAAVIEAAIKWLRHENAKGAYIYIRPVGTN